MITFNSFVTEWNPCQNRINLIFQKLFAIIEVEIGMEFVSILTIPNFGWYYHNKHFDEICSLHNSKNYGNFYSTKKTSSVNLHVANVHSQQFMFLLRWLQVLLFVNISKIEFWNVIAYTISIRLKKFSQDYHRKICIHYLPIWMITRLYVNIAHKTASHCKTSLFL